MPRPAPLIADYGEAQRLLPDYDHYLGPSRVTVAGLTGQTHVAALCVQKVAEAGRRQRERGVTDGTEVFAWSDLSLISTGANGAALLREFLRAERGLDEPEHSALMEEAWLRVGCPPFWQPVILRTIYGRPAIPISGDVNQLTNQLIRSRLADEFRPRSGVLEPVVRANRSSPAFVLPSVDEELNGRLIWSSASVDVRVKTHTLAVLMAYEVEGIWRAFDSSLPAAFRPPFPLSCSNFLNLLLLYDLYKSNPTESECSLHDFVTCARHAATFQLGDNGYRRMYDWIVKHFGQQHAGAPVGRVALAQTVVNWWTTYKIWPSPVTRLPTRRPPTQPIPILPLFLLRQFAHEIERVSSKPCEWLSTRVRGSTWLTISPADEELACFPPTLASLAWRVRWVLGGIPHHPPRSTPVHNLNTRRPTAGAGQRECTVPFTRWRRFEQGWRAAERGSKASMVE
uniref:BY PROTMAP: gi/342319737/gb/EGU11684.1/ putative Proteophosphoglycan ppg3 [Rhodotorula glutinis ATCC 204091] n=1 Tax=Rhodotorula toruloides TaxID=5286 RepID=A0A0K3CD14_RHOTO